LFNNIIEIAVCSQLHGTDMEINFNIQRCPRRRILWDGGVGAIITLDVGTPQLLLLICWMLMVMASVKDLLLAL